MPTAVQVAYQAPLAETVAPPNPQPNRLGEIEGGELSLEQLVAAVEASNPSLQAAAAAWNAAAQRYPQAVSLDDPMFTYMISPGVGRDGDGSGWMAQFSQRVPWPGKRICAARPQARRPMPCTASWARPACVWSK